MRLRSVKRSPPPPLDDARYVQTAAARGSEATLSRFAFKFGLFPNGVFEPAPSTHLLFCGHRGSGKTTELRRYCHKLSGPERYLSIEVSVNDLLDRHNFEYADLLMALASALCTELEARQVNLPDANIEPLKKWFSQHIKVSESATEFNAELAAQAQARTGIPLLASLFARVTTSFKTNATYKDELRRQVRNSFSQIVEAFNCFLAAAQNSAAQQQVARCFLFVVDGTDKLPADDAARLFIDNIQQLQEIKAHIVYTAPFSLSYMRNVGGAGIDSRFLPLIQISEQDDTPIAANRAVMRELLLKRAAKSLFDSEETINSLISESGGNPRELLRLLQTSCGFAEGTQIDAAIVERAVKDLAGTYRRFLEPEDYEQLAKIDITPGHLGNDEHTRRLLNELALLEYNSGKWRRTHPVVMRLDGYQEAKRRLLDSK
jgi:hypothetical protein